MSSHRILVVEDQREVSRLLRSALETLEHDLTVVECPSGEEAILDSSRNRIDLLVADYRLPGVSGIELMRKVRKDHRKAKVILITGQTDPKVRKEVAEAGADAFFIKPVPMADFLDAVERHLGLVETMLPPEPIAPDDEEMVRTLPDLLTGLRQDLEAGSVILLNDTGRVLARAGEMPESNNEVALISSLLSIHSAGRKISRVLGQQAPSSWHVFDGGKFDLIFAPVGASYAMLILGKGLAAEDRVLRTIDIFSAACKPIEQALTLAPTTPAGAAVAASQEAPTTPTEAVEQSAKELEPLLKDAKKKLKASEVNDFWDKAVDSHKAPTKPDMLSYEQAKQLGLAPEDES
jgi:DNA-binding response OmpR family regulator